MKKKAAKKTAVKKTAKKMGLLLMLMSLAIPTGCGTSEDGSAKVPSIVKIGEEEPEDGQSEASADGQDAAEGSTEGSQEVSSEKEQQGPEGSGSQNGQKEESAEFKFDDLANTTFYFSSGAGAWFTELYINADGSFEGHYQDADMGDNGDSYPNGTLYYCDFSGTFDLLEKVDILTYKMKLSSIAFEEEPEKEEIIDGVRYIYSTAYGLDGGEEFYLYLPGTKLADLPEEYQRWVGYYSLDSTEETKLQFYGLYNVNMEEGFSSAQYEEQSLSERIALEISFAEELDRDLEAKLQTAGTRQDMEESGGELYQLWDDTLNIVWKLLEAELDQKDMEALRVQEREWIAVRDAEAEAAGQAYEDSSMQDLEKALKAAELTKARVYELAEYAEGR